jgi:hypothetical protein
MTTSDLPLVVHANLGAEERDGPRGPLPARVELVLSRLATCLRALFGARATFDDVEHTGPTMPCSDAPAFPWLAVPGLWPWLSTQASAARAIELGLPHRASAPDVVRRVHDKAFAAPFASTHAGAPLSTPLDVDMLTKAHVEALVAAWPAWARARFTLKPRFGTSGRGRVAGVDGKLPPHARLDRLRGGAVLEPWLARIADLSSQWRIDDCGPQLLGTTTQIVSAAGIWLGNTFIADAVPRAEEHHDALVAGARPVVEAAHRAGFRGPCGVDAMTYRGPDGSVALRPVVELNARFTSGIVGLGLARTHKVAVGARCTFRLDADAPLTVLEPAL